MEIWECNALGTSDGSDFLIHQLGQDSLIKPFKAINQSNYQRTWNILKEQIISHRLLKKKKKTCVSIYHLKRRHHV